jgi:hypothetical protein
MNESWCPAIQMSGLSISITAAKSSHMYNMVKQGKYFVFFDDFEFAELR